MSAFGPFGLEGKVALITGATSGIGRACAEVMAEAGASVAVAGRDEGRGAEVRDAIRKDGGTAEFVRLDVTQPADCDRAIAEATRLFGRLDVLVNNAGISGGGAVTELSDEVWSRVLETNLSGVFYMSRAAIPALRQGGGAVVNVASDWSLFAAPGEAAYCASKGGVLMLTKAMALDHARQGIRVNCVCPAEVDTPLLVKGTAAAGIDHAKAMKDWAEALPLGRVGVPRDVAYAVLYLASDAAAFLTGAALPVDGGSTSR